MKRFTVAASWLVAATMLTGCLGRPNPRVSQIVKQPANDDDDDEVLAFTYDADGRIERVVKSEGDDVRTWTLAWSDGLLTNVAIEEGDGEVVHELAYESGKLVSVHSQGDSDGASEGVFTYEGDRFVKSEVTSENGAVKTMSVAYGDDGQIESMQRDDVRIAIESSDGLLSSLTIDDGEEAPTTFELSFDDDTKQLDEIVYARETELGGTDATVRSVVAFDYDDEGRVASTTEIIDMGDIQADVATTAVEYEDGDARSLDVSADQVFLFGFFFDMKGGHWGTFDNTTTVPRLAFPSW